MSQKRPWYNFSSFEFFSVLFISFLSSQKWQFWCLANLFNAVNLRSVRRLARPFTNFWRGQNLKSTLGGFDNKRECFSNDWLEPLLPLDTFGKPMIIMIQNLLTEFIFSKLIFCKYSKWKL